MRDGMKYYERAVMIITIIMIITRTIIACDISQHLFEDSHSPDAITNIFRLPYLRLLPIS